MSEMTYEPKNNTVLEKYEWDSPWWEQTGNHTAKRVFYIGDSISYGLRGACTVASDNTLLFDNFPSSKALDNPYFEESITLFAKQEEYRSVILFNNGLHGFHLDITQYEALYERFAQFLLSSFPGTPLVLVLTTTVADAEELELVKARNEAVKRIAARLSLPILDLFAVTDAHKDLLSQDGVHFTPEGYGVMAKVIVEYVNHLLA